jgi:hypothetical protein
MRNSLSLSKTDVKLPSEAIARRAGIDIRGRFLEDERGKRYPAITGLAQKLLAKGHSLLLKQRTFNFYRCQTEADIQVSAAQPKRVQNKYFERPKYKIASFEQQREIIEIVIPAPPSEVFERSSHPIEPQKPETEAVEALAMQVKTLTAKINPECAISRTNAQQLIDLYGISSVRRALSTMKPLHAKDKITNPAGFMVVASRVNWRKQQTQPVLTPRFRPITRRKRSASSEPKYDPF